MDLLWILVAVLFAVWLAGLFVASITSPLIHLLLILAVIIALFRLLRGEATV